MAPFFDHEDLAGQQPLDTREDRLAPRGELELQQLIGGFGADLLGVATTGAQTQRHDGLGFGREDHALRLDGVVERLDAEGIAGQDHAVPDRIVQREREHATHVFEEVEAVPVVERQQGVRNRTPSAIRLPAWRP